MRSLAIARQSCAFQNDAGQQRMNAQGLGQAPADVGVGFQCSSHRSRNVLLHMASGRQQIGMDYYFPYAVRRALLEGLGNVRRCKLQMGDADADLRRALLHQLSHFYQGGVRRRIVRAVIDNQQGKL